MKLHVAACSEIGPKKSENEDSFACVSQAGSLECGTLDCTESEPLICGVCDGVGGHKAGSFASMAISKRFGELLAFKPGTADIYAVMQTAIFEWHEALMGAVESDPQKQGAASTIAVACLYGDRMVTALVGDSRIYRLRDGSLTQLTQDQSPVADMVRGGIISEEEARSHPIRNLISQALGAKDLVPESIATDEFDLKPGDLLLLSTDGFHHAWAHDELASKLQALSSCSQADELHEYLAQAVHDCHENGVSDDATAILVCVN